MNKLFFSVALVLFFSTLSAQQTPAGLQVNQKAPSFTANDQDDKLISLESELKKGPVVLVFYRGYWCPYCNKQLKKLEDSLSLILEKGASLIAVTPEQEEGIDKTIEKTKASYSIISDKGLKIMKSYDVAFAVSEKTIKSYQRHGIDFNVVNGEANGANLPVPAVYVINKEGTIVYRHFDADYTKRASVTEILKYL